ncbi:tRNA lysidine(34) synthetase TilS [Psychromonas antarctica]|uniref:tRNA lysidine(34) synthetase TilS n=1 Tax=Psychromonas antarctica TaxID=67573 RepID=UPI001EE8BF46|nr:tRNA lysidine(34) synthetase TilS [Psychromonas antarctica]MCG6199683.1 tRNA lysidine(34) synthetase TilS [Psychromonas antarctica]
MQKQDLLDSFGKQLELLSVPPAANFHIALSGGLDSVVLLHLFARLRERGANLTLNAHHIHHGLSENGDCWMDFCAALCVTLKIDFTCSKVHLNRQTRTSLEALAREKRYHCLTQSLSENSYLVTAHHQDDQLETLLLALKRGAGNTGLQGIHHQQKLKLGYLIRPLLNFSRAQLADYATCFELHWIEDESNHDQLFDRNFIRHSITPLLKNRWPGIAKSVARTATICQEQQQILDEIAAQDFSASVFYFLNQQALKFEQLKQLSTGRRNNLLRFWFKDNCLDYPSAAQLHVIWTDVVLATDDALPVMQFKGYSIRRYRKHLYLLKDLDIAVNRGESVTWQGEQQISLADGRVKLLFIQDADNHNRSDIFKYQENAKIEICFRQHLPAQLTCQPIGRNGSRSLKKLLHEYHVPPWLRDLIPFIVIDGELRAAIGLWQCQTSRSEIGVHNLSIVFA